ncbi:MAG TPA: class I adenylate-forming enzyme family protein [Actinomycetota bacterium]|jgi:O-succinylbenzoic acid--CoA ligase|nr:class I adenylate-forming enzyme family protein [Actinomycetota bacterium]
MQATFGLAAGELLAVEFPPGPAWVEVVRRCWKDGVPFLPLDVRLGEDERRRLIDRARPAALLDATGNLTVFTPGEPVTEGVAVVVASSGTSGEHRLVELTRSAIEASVAGSTASLGVGVGDPWISCLTPAHIGGLLVLLRAEILGVPAVVLGGFDADAVEAARQRGAHVSLVPTLVGRLLDHGGGQVPGGLLLVGGGALEPELRTRAERGGARVVQTYGLTESCGGVVYDGEPFQGTSVRIGDHARIELRGPTIMEGYRNDAAATGEAFDVQGWLRTGDAGTIDDLGRVYVHGRFDDAIRTGGETVWPDEVERALADHPKVRDVAVVGRPHPGWGQQVVAFIVPVSIDAPPGVEEVRAFLAGRVAPFKAPRELMLVPEIPRTASGKVRRSALPLT